MKRCLRRDERGSVYTEFLLVMPPLLTFALAIFQLTELYAAKVTTDHAALAAARTASVVMPDDPKHYGGEAVNALGGRREEAVRVAAIRALAPFVVDANVTDVEVRFPDGLSTVEVSASFQCKVALASMLVCRGGPRSLTARATLPHQTARYVYAALAGGTSDANP